MCTASWLLRDGGFELFFNRDESVRRAPARAPEIVLVEGVRALFPVDGEAGGTWIAANELGLALCLLNAREGAPEPHAGRASRGWIVRGLAGSSSVAEVEHALRSLDLAPYPGFRLAAFEPGRAPRTWRWTEQGLREEPAVRPLVSSSLGEERAFVSRAAVLRALAPGEPDRATLAAFQASHAPERGPWSPCMHREDAATQSATHVVVGPREVALRYAPGPPCTVAYGPALVLARTRDVGARADGAREREGR